MKTVRENLLNNQNVSVAGAYNESMTRDADSLSFTIGLLESLNFTEKEELQKIWFTFQNEDGGWVTYNDSKALRSRLELSSQDDVSGWTMPHTCVSAVSAYILKFLDTHQDRYENTIRYLIDCQTDSGNISSYWWTNSVYSTSFFIMALSNKDEYRVQLTKAKKWLLAQQNSDGSWSVSESNTTKSTFYTALALKALIISGQTAEQTNIEEGLIWLLNTQLKDGSWPVLRILRIPAPDVIDPGKVSRWRKSSFGVNTLIDDHIGNFTTSTVVNTFSWYLQSIGYENENKNSTTFA